MVSYRRQLCLLFVVALCAFVVLPISPATAQVLDCEDDDCPLLEECNTDDCGGILEECNTDDCGGILEECNTDDCNSLPVCPDQTLDECLPAIDPGSLVKLGCTPDSLFADPPVVATLTITGYGGVDPNECKIVSDDDPVMVCLENFGVPVPGSCLAHRQQGPSMTVPCTPGSWQTVVSVPYLGVAHSDPTVILDPLDCWTPPPGRP